MVTYLSAGAIMVKGLSSLLLATLLACAPAPLISCSSGPALTCDEHHPSADKILNEIALPTYKVLVEDDGVQWSGSAVAIDRRTLITAHHVATDMAGHAADKILIYSRLGNHKVITTATVYKLLPESDLAMLVSHVDLPYVAEWASAAEIRANIAWGTRVWVSGHALGADDPVVTDGTINSVRDDRFIRYSAAQIYGNSGGPVYSLINGRFKLVSIAQAGYLSRGTMVTHMSLGVNPFTLERFIRENS